MAARDEIDVVESRNRGALTSVVINSERRKVLAED